MKDKSESRVKESNGFDVPIHDDVLTKPSFNLPDMLSDSFGDFIAVFHAVSLHAFSRPTALAWLPRQPPSGKTSEPPACHDACHPIRNVAKREV